MKEEPICILPIGATEEHGRHLPLGSDTIQASSMAEALAERLNALVLPPIPYGISSSLRDFPGTISISFESLHLMVRDILREAVRNGFKKIIVLSSHGAQAHMAAIRTACEEVVEGTDAKIIALCDYEIAYRLRGTASVPQDDGHGGMIETSRMLFIAPSLVGSDRPSGTDTSPPFTVLRRRRQYFTEGIIGNSSSATPELGRQVNSYIIEEIVKLAKAVM